jgi:hypothetical protein
MGVLGSVRWLALSMALVNPVGAQSTVVVDWRAGVVETESVGFSKEGLDETRSKMMSQRAAKLMALRDIAEFIQGVHVSSETTVEDAMMVGDVVQGRVQSVIKQAHQIGATRYDSNGMATVRMRVKFEGNLADALLPQSGFGTFSQLGFGSLPQPGIPDADHPQAPESTANVTGLVLDARGLNLVSAMVPRILAEDGQVIYGPGQVNRESAVQNGGLVAYEKTLQAAYQNDRVGNAPLTVKAVSGQGTYRANAVISEQDVHKIQKAVEGRTFLNQCRVVFVID